jgi:hypothetical protein
VRDQTFTTSLGDPAPQPLPLGPRLVGLAILCVTLFGLATLVGMVADAWA